MTVTLAALFSLPGVIHVHSPKTTDLHLHPERGPALQLDSRACRADDLFIAVRGSRFDSHSLVPELLQKSVNVVVDRVGFEELESTLAKLHPSPCILVVEDTRDWAPRAAARVGGLELADLQVLGFTGTNGKSTCTWILQHLLQAQDPLCALIGTIESRFGRGEACPTALTTPDPLGLARLAQDLLEAGGRQLVMEVSSHAIHQKRDAVFSFDTCVFLNLSPEHLDYHHDMETYYKVKASFMMRPECTLRLVNGDDPMGQRLQSELSCLPVRSFGRSASCDWRLTRLVQERGEMFLSFEFESQTHQLRAPLIGDFNAMNLMATVAVAMHAGLSLEQIQKGLLTLPPVPGRMELCPLPSVKAPRVLIDYAHSPDGYEKVFDTLTQSAFTRIHTVFGCGGNRDRSNRPIMLELACKHSEHVFVTLDNPRDEDPERIFADMLRASELSKCESVSRIDDRAAAISHAMLGLGEDDLLLILGKGHERYQIIGSQKIDFDERAIVQSAWLKIQEEDRTSRGDESQEDGDEDA